MTPTRDRLSVREGMTPPPALREGVPRSLESALRRWIWETASLDSNVVEHALIRLDLVLPDAYWQRYQKELNERSAKQAALNAEWKAKQDARTEQDATAYLTRPQPLPMPANPRARFLAYATDIEILWNIVDDLLHELCIEPLGPQTSPLVGLSKWSDTRRTKKITEPLRQLLEESRSVYEVSPDQRGLRRRMDVFLAEHVNRTAMSAEDAGYPQVRKHLLRAQDKLYVLHPDPSGAYVEVIRAVEAVACPLFLPADQSPTLGKVRNHLRDAGDKYEYVLADKSGAPGSTEGIVAMLSDIWETTRDGTRTTWTRSGGSWRTRSSHGHPAGQPHPTRGLGPHQRRGIAPQRRTGDAGRAGGSPRTRPDSGFLRIPGGPRDGQPRGHAHHDRQGTRPSCYRRHDGADSTCTADRRRSSGSGGSVSGRQGRSP